MASSALRTSAGVDSFSSKPAGLRFVPAERAVHLVAVEVGGLGRLLHRHPELDHVQEELQQVLILRIAALHGEREIRQAVLERKSRRKRGAWPLAGATTLNGLSASSSTNACIRWLMPIPVRPAMHAGTHAPLGVTETTHPFSSAASIDVVPARNASSCAGALQP